jgi:hypothetical protein
MKNLVHVMFRSQQRTLKQEMLHMEKLGRFAEPPPFGARIGMVSQW